MTKNSFLSLILYKKRQIAQGIVEFDLRAPDQAELPTFQAGSHISIRTPSGKINKYSLCNNPSERHRYVIAVKREEEGEGGSKSLVDNTNEGDAIDILALENVFELTPIRPEYLFIAAGIGITPIYAMIQSLVTEGNMSFQLIYLTREPAETAYLDEIMNSSWSNHVILHHTHGVSDDRFDLWPLLENQKNRQIYCCGPQRLMEEVRAMTGHWAGHTVTFESFGVDESLFQPNQAFTVKLQNTGTCFEVDATTTLLQALDQHNVHVPRSCESGTCGTCRTGLISGEVEHRDMVLDDSEKEDNIMVCVSRGKGGTLVLDL